MILARNVKGKVVCIHQLVPVEGQPRRLGGEGHLAHPIAAESLTQRPSRVVPCHIVFLRVVQACCVNSNVSDSATLEFDECHWVLCASLAARYNCSTRVIVG